MECYKHIVTDQRDITIRDLRYRVAELEHVVRSNDQRIHELKVTAASLNRTACHGSEKGNPMTQPKTHQVLLLWDLGEGADLYALTVTPDEFEGLRSINSLFYGLDLPEELHRAWIRVNVSLSNDIICVPDHAKDCIGKWMGSKLNPGQVVTLNGDWTVVSSGMAP